MGASPSLPSMSHCMIAPHTGTRHGHHPDRYCLPRKALSSSTPRRFAPALTVPPELRRLRVDAQQTVATDVDSKPRPNDRLVLAFA